MTASSSTPTRPPDPPEVVRVVYVPCPPSRRPLWHWAVVLIAPWAVIAVFLVRWLFLLLLTGLGMAVALAGGLLWLVGCAIAVRWPDAGEPWMELGGGIGHGMIRAVDSMNGHTVP